MFKRIHFACNHKKFVIGNMKKCDISRINCIRELPQFNGHIRISISPSRDHNLKNLKQRCMTCLIMFGWMKKK